MCYTNLNFVYVSGMIFLELHDKFNLSFIGDIPVMFYHILFRDDMFT